MSFGDLLSEGWDKLKGSFSVQTGTNADGNPTYGTDWGQIASIGGLRHFVHLSLHILPCNSITFSEEAL